MNQWVTNELLAPLICWAVGTIMSKLEQLAQAAQQEQLPRQDDTRKDSARQSMSVLDKLASAQSSRNEDEALIEAFRIVAQERRKGTQNGK